MPLKVGLQLRALRQPLKDALSTAGRLHVEGVEIDARSELRPQDLSDTAVRSIRKLLSDNDLTCCAVSFATRRGYHVQADLEARVDATKAAMNMAARLGAPIVVNQIGHVPAETEGPEWQLLLAVLSDLGAYGHRVGAMLAAETGNESGAHLAKVISALPEGSMVVDLNPGKLVRNGHSPTAAVQELYRSLVHVHAQDAVRHVAEDVPFGRGSVDFPALVGVLQDYDYRGFYTVAFEHSAEPLAAAEQAVEYLRNL